MKVKAGENTKAAEAQRKRDTDKDAKFVKILLNEIDDPNDPFNF